VYLGQAFPDQVLLFAASAWQHGKALLLASSGGAIAILTL